MFLLFGMFWSLVRSVRKICAWLTYDPDDWDPEDLLASLDDR